ncbi:hypothetical protein A3C86_00405 [Candidatus Kaiserbacteria bacterium RIFCSPHIGHO2_02_FULL_49_16]|uniref:30S ribosomal protein S21 n=1 Tax=Candidatus Kaiserbacteria bacterium RIFCSPHIGHO2_02_FULL_49_16 TaxID=1798490 RepID=A0A1F6DHI3_9BACT|nr:MAG: hypothetical protein A3C86_00405 [Candidatus Kaiserbacteria bacterium RIFCSPHIGHO2_02_FULL_49_16]
MINAEVSKSGSETAISTIRKFSRKVRNAGLVRIVRDKRYFERGASKIVKKKRTLKSIRRRKEYSRLLKEGKATEEPTRHGNVARFPSQTNESQQARPSEGAPVAR